MNVGIVGFGSIGTEVAKALLEGVENFYLYGISSRSKTNAEERISKLKKSIEIFDLETLINNCQIIIDCAPKEAFRDIATRCISEGKTLITVSGSGILDNFDLIETPKKNNSQIILATGAILAKAFPANVNVAAAVGLAGIGANKTQLEIWADPNLERNTHKVEVKSDSAEFEMSIQNVQTPENPGTGRITGLSVIACLRGLKSSLKVGS